jgi:hypothetical protein
VLSVVRVRRKLKLLLATVLSVSGDSFDLICHLPFIPAFVVDDSNLRLMAHTVACI